MSYSLEAEGRHHHLYFRRNKRLDVWFTDKETLARTQFLKEDRCFRLVHNPYPHLGSHLPVRLVHGFESLIEELLS